MAKPFISIEFNALLIDFNRKFEEIKEGKQTDENQLITSYNNFIRYIQQDYRNKTKETKKFIDSTIGNCRSNLKKCADKLNILIDFPAPILGFITSVNFPKPEPKPTPGPVPQPKPIVNDIPIPNPTMTDFGYIAQVGTVIKKTYAGETDGLERFIESLLLANDLSTEAQRPTLIRFIKTKCEGVAREAISELEAEPTTVQQIINALRNKIKVESSKVVLGRLMALKADKSTLQNFQEKGEQLAEKLRLAYISEGNPPLVAKSMAIDQTVEMCRASAKTTLAKSIICSTAFKEPKEVLARLVVEISKENKEIKEAQVLSYTDNRGRGRGRGDFRGRFQNNNNNFRGNYRQNNYNNNNYNNQNWRGRGRGRGNYRGRNNYNNYNNYRQDRNDGRQVYVIQENQEAPTQERGNGQNNQANVMTLRQVNH